MKTHFPMRTQLGPGQSLHVRGERGMTILAASGKVCIGTAPTWLSDQFLAEKILLCEGEVHVLQNSGWIVISAQADAEVLGIADHARSAWTIEYGWSLAALHIGRWWQRLMGKAERGPAIKHY